MFAINPSSGALSVREGVEFDHEGQEIYRFLVDADDGNGGLSSAEVAVQIGDVNEAPQFPAAAQTTYQVAARAMISFFVAPASDQDCRRQRYLYGEFGGQLDEFRCRYAGLYGAAGCTAGQPRGDLGGNRCRWSARSAGVANQRCCGRQQCAVFCQCADADGYTIPRRQDAVESGTGIGSIVADDPDADTLIYQIVSGDDADLFEIDESSGKIVVAAGEELTARERPYRFTVEVADGRGGIATVVVEVTVQEAVAEADAPNQDPVVMLAIDRAVAVAAIDLIQARLNASTRPTGGAGLAQLADQSAPYLQLASAQQQWEDWRYEDEHETDTGERMAWRDFLHSGGFDFALDGSQSGGPQGRIWGAASRASVDGSPLADGGLVFYDGKINMVMMGAEYRTSSKRFGIAFGNSNSEVLVGELKTIAVERKLNVVYPYLSLPISDRVQMWVSAGFGSGEYMRGANMDNAAQTARDTGYLSVASGVEGNWSHDLVEIDSGVKALVVRSKMDALGMSPEATGKAWRLQADFKASSSFAATSGIELRPFVGAHLYHDGGDEWLGSNAVDTSAGINLKWDRGLQAGFSSRWNTNDDGDVNEERLDASISYDFGLDGQGLLLEVAPRMSSSSDAENDRSLSGSASYGLPVRLFADAGLATFKADFASADKGIVVERYGFRFAGRRMDVDLAADGTGDSWRIDLKLR